LGSFVVTHEVPESMSLKDLARDIHVQMEWGKRHKLPIFSLLGFYFARFAQLFFSQDRQHKFYPKYHPLWAGTTNVNLNTMWRQNETVPIDYFRAVSTGPVSPLVFSFTTVRDIVNVGVSFRLAAFSRKDVDEVVARFVALNKQFTV
jgi:hypothetical protein